VEPARSVFTSEIEGWCGGTSVVVVGTGGAVGPAGDAVVAGAAVVVVVAGLVVVVVVVVVGVAVVVMPVVGVVVVVPGLVVVVAEQLEGVFACAVPGGAGLTPSPQFANSCTLTRTERLEPTENVPEKENLSADVNAPWPICVHVAPLSVELKTRTSLFVRLALVEPAHAVAVYDAPPPQASETVTNELCADASGTNITAKTTTKLPNASRRSLPNDRRNPCRRILTPSFVFALT